jgi:hypothetical protein
MKALVLSAFDEFHHFARTNAYVHQFLRGSYAEIFVFAPSAAAPIFSSVDKVITHDNYTENIYPFILEIVKESRNLKVYNQNGLVKIIFEFVKKNNVDVIFMFLGTQDDTEQLNIIFKGQVQFIHSLGIPQDFKMIGDFILNGGNILPFKHDVEIVSEIAPDVYKNSALIITRNFRNKQPYYNTKQSTLRKYIYDANKIGLNVINVGSPTLPYKKKMNVNLIDLLNFKKAKQPKYLELNDLTYSQMLALAVNAKVWQLLPHAGGFSIHIASQANLIVDGPEFCKTSEGYYLADIRKRRSDLKTYSNFLEFERDESSNHIVENMHSIIYEEKVLRLI